MLRKFRYVSCTVQLMSTAILLRPNVCLQATAFVGSPERINCGALGARVFDFGFACLTPQKNLFHGLRATAVVSGGSDRSRRVKAQLMTQLSFGNIGRTSLGWLNAD